MATTLAVQLAKAYLHIGPLFVVQLAAIFGTLLLVRAATVAGHLLNLSGVLTASKVLLSICVLHNHPCATCSSLTAIRVPLVWFIASTVQRREIKTQEERGDQ